MHFKTLVTTAYGDLNKDGLEDLAIVTQDTIHELAPYCLEVFFRQANNDLKLIVSTTKAIPPQFPNGREYYQRENEFDDLSIEQGVLWIITSFIRGGEEHQFKFQNDHFELIGYSFAYVERSTQSLIDYNLSTGRRIEKEGLISEDTNQVTLDKIVKIFPLPSLESFNSDALDLHNFLFSDSINTFMLNTQSVNPKYSIGFGRFTSESNYCNVYVIENSTHIKIIWTDNDEYEFCGFTGNFNPSPNGRYIILEKIEQGVVDDGVSKEYHENYFCWLIDLQDKRVISQFQGDCGGEWTENNEWVMGEDVLFKPEN